jgi:hypothetical protein
MDGSYRIGIVAFVLVLILGIGSAIFHERLIRLYRVIRLFDQDVIVENFRHMDGIIGTRTVHKADQVRQPLRKILSHCQLHSLTTGKASTCSNSSKINTPPV